MRIIRSVRGVAVFAIAASLAACASHPAPENDAGGGRDAAAAMQWAANGWLTPGPSGDPEVIGLFETRGECDAAVEAWMSRQVVGNPVHGECLPIDRH
ncbi:MAG: hypothetical protein VX640_11835 [Pseudomonadota bacterium]|nr:hypothetical protein [Pseudomonadota bacterium]